MNESTRERREESATFGVCVCVCVWLCVLSSSSCSRWLCDVTVLVFQTESHKRKYQWFVLFGSLTRQGHD